MALLMLLAAFAAIALVGLVVVGTLIKVVLWGVFLPIRLLLGVLLLPLLFVIKLVVGTILLAVVGPIVLVATACRDHRQPRGRCRTAAATLPDRVRRVSAGPVEQASGA